MTAPSGDSPPDALQFDAAEPATAAAAAPAGVTCANCQKAVTTTYHMLNELVICSSCRGRLERELSGGSGVGRFSGALLWGLGGAAVGAAIYYAVLALTGYEVGLIAIVVGWLVGRGVQKGSGGRGGPAYQAIAVLLTYFAIVSTYIPLIITAAQGQVSADKVSADSAAALETQRLLDSLQVAGGPAAAASSDSTVVAAADTVTSAQAQPTFGGFVMGIAFLLAFAAAVPFLAGISNIIGLLIIGFALYQAWKMNKRVPIAFTGPFKVGTAPA